MDKIWSNININNKGIKGERTSHDFLTFYFIGQILREIREKDKETNFIILREQPITFIIIGDMGTQWDTVQRAHSLIAEATTKKPPVTTTLRPRDIHPKRESEKRRLCNVLCKTAQLHTLTRRQISGLMKNVLCRNCATPDLEIFSLGFLKKMWRIPRRAVQHHRKLKRANPGLILKVLCTSFSSVFNWKLYFKLLTEEMRILSLSTNQIPLYNDSAVQTVYIGIYKLRFCLTTSAQTIRLYKFFCDNKINKNKYLGGNMSKKYETKTPFSDIIGTHCESCIRRKPILDYFICEALTQFYFQGPKKTTTCFAYCDSEKVPNSSTGILHGSQLTGLSEAYHEDVHRGEGGGGASEKNTNKKKIKNRYPDFVKDTTWCN